VSLSLDLLGLPVGFPDCPFTHVIYLFLLFLQRAHTVDVSKPMGSRMKERTKEILLFVKRRLFFALIVGTGSSAGLMVLIYVATSGAPPAGAENLSWFGLSPWFGFSVIMWSLFFGVSFAFSFMPKSSEGGGIWGGNGDNGGGNGGG